MNNLNKQTWLITGATRGLGFQVAMAAQQAGANVVATGRNLQKLEKAFGDTKNMLLLELDVCNEAQAKVTAEAAFKKFGSIDVLVNNAGFGQLGLFEEVEQTDVKVQFETNVFGLMSMCRTVLPVMREQKSGLIYNISSIGGSLGFENASIYCAAKFAVEGFSESLAMEVKQFGIDITIVQPGFFRTDFLDQSSVQFGTIEIDDYAQYGKALNNVYHSKNQKQPGDPTKLGQMLVEIAQKPERPIRLAAGSDAVEYLTTAIKKRQNDLEKWASYSHRTDINE